MRLPQSWQDHSLLDDEPFLTEFLLRTAGPLKRSRIPSQDADELWVGRIADELRKTDGGLRAAEAWIHVAFHEIKTKTKTLRLKPGVGAGEGGLEIFVRVFWLIYENQYEEALRLLNKERSKRFFEYSIPTSHSKQGRKDPIAGENTSAGSLEGEFRQTDHPIERSHSPAKLCDVELSNVDGQVCDKPAALDGKAMQPPDWPMKRKNAADEDTNTSVSGGSRMVNERIKTTKKPKFATSTDDDAESPMSRISQPESRSAGVASYSRTVDQGERIKSHARRTNELPTGQNRTRERAGRMKIESVAEVVRENKGTLLQPNRHNQVNKGEGIYMARSVPAGAGTGAWDPCFHMVSKPSQDHTKGLARNSQDQQLPRLTKSRQPSRHGFLSVEKRRRTRRAISAPPAKRARPGVDGDPTSVGHPNRVTMTKQECTSLQTAGQQYPPVVSGSSTAVDTRVNTSVIHPRVNSIPNVGSLRQLPAVTETPIVGNIQIDQPNLSEGCASRVAMVKCVPRTTPNTYEHSLIEPSPSMEPWGSVRQPTQPLRPQGPGSSARHDTTHVPRGAPTLEEWEKYPGDILADPNEMQDPVADDDYMNVEYLRPLMNQSDQRQQDKPSLPKLPPIWAHSRQELCESFDWFRSYQSGVYFGNNVVKGYLLSAFSSSRDIFHHEGKLIISHGGGKAESLHTRQGQTETRLAADQLAQDKSIRALLANYHSRRPLVLLIDDRYVLFKYDLVPTAVTYAVLGYYLITHAWAEYQPAQNDSGQVVRYKFAFQWCEDQGDPWWTAMDHSSTGDNTVSVSSMCSSPTPTPPSRETPVKSESVPFSELRPSKAGEIYVQCSQCLERSPHVYRQPGWMCLNAACSTFWKQSDGNAPQTQLEYSDEFLQLLPMPRLPTDCRDLRPPLPVIRSNGGITTDYAFSKGWHCRDCGRLSSRFKWQHWECSNCQAIFGIPGRVREAREFWGQLKKYDIQDHFLAAKVSCRKKIKIKMVANGTITCQTYELPGGGQIHHIRADPRANTEADIVFKQYQEQAADGRLAFRRWPLRSHKCRGSLLTNYFSQNAGEPYQYVGGTANTVPFDAAPSAVVKARELIQDRVVECLGRKVQFNEVLSAAYMERQKMAFHSDSEKGLGPLVAGLSLGSAALMHFRRHTQFIPVDQPRRIDVTFILRHGDVLVMDGEGVQRCYEHTVAPVNFRIAATARCITPS